MWFTDARVVPPLPSRETPRRRNAEYERDRQFRMAAVQWARKHPDRVVQLAGIKFVRMWNIWPNERSLSGWRMRLLVAAGYVPVMAFAAVGAWWFVRRDWPFAVCLLPAVYFAVLHVVFVSSIRYRQPAILTLIVLAAGAAMAVWRWRANAGRTTADMDVGGNS
jgi:hypothetical protein